MQKIKVIIIAILVLIDVAKAGIVKVQRNANNDIFDNKVVNSITNVSKHETVADIKLFDIKDESSDKNIRKRNDVITKMDVSDNVGIQSGDTRSKKADGNEIAQFNTDGAQGVNNVDLETVNNNVRRKRDVVKSNSCTILNEKFKRERKPGKLEFLHQGKRYQIVVMSSNRPPGKALAALIAAAIRHKAGYEDTVSRIVDNRTVSQLAATLPALSAKYFNDDKVVIHVDADMEESEDRPVIPNCPPSPQSCSVAGSRLQIMGTTPSANVRVFAVLSNDYLKTSNCSDANYWLFFRNRALLEQCGFIQPSSLCIPVYMVPEVYSEINLKTKTLGHEIPFCENNGIDRNELNKKLKADTTSFIFIDYDLGYSKNDSRVRAVQLSSELFPHTRTVAYRLSDLYLFLKFGPKIAEILNTTIPTPEDLREVLDLSTYTKDIDEAACAWSNDNIEKFNKWTKTTERQLWFLAVLCKGKLKDEYTDIVNILNTSSFFTENIKEFNYVLYIKSVNCNDPNILSEEIVKLTRRTDWVDFGGVVAPAVGAKEVAHATSTMQLVFYDVPSSETILQNATSTISGGLSLLVRSYLNYFRKQDWKRIAVISEDSDVAKSVTRELKTAVLLKEKILYKIDRIAIAEILMSFRDDNARVFFLNVGYKTANFIACEVAKLGMEDKIEYAWVAREWQPFENCIKEVKMLTISYWWQGGNDTFIKDMGGNADMRSLFDQLWKNSSWPVLTAPLVDAFLMMIYRLEKVIHNHPEYSYDLHSANFTRLLTQYGNESISGVVQTIKQNNFMQYNPLVFVYEWRSQTNKLIGIWRANSDNNDIIPIFERFDGDQIPKDGRSHCTTTTSGDEFNPTCHTVIWASSSVVLVIVMVAMWWLRGLRLAKLKKRERETLMRLLSRCERTAAVLEAYLVDRAALELFEELGSGHFGRVRFGMLRVRNRLPTPVAAKTLRDDAAPAEEAEFLREGSIMATLSHDHIVRLVGVCADTDGPPLLLMEHAFFGDLLKYLRQRRHLAEIFERDSRFSQFSDDAPLHVPEDLKKSPDPEARHVSPEELTRLAREATEALDYMSVHHLLHRDVRAANCLVDARRILKLADFGMARNVEAKNRSPSDNPEESEDYKYICRRRGVFPVPWMAPESLERGEFSHASDVWALGVLLLEIATLGARPYGSWKPIQVLRFVQSGGRPPLPRDASYHTCEVTEMCWTDDPTERASAKEVHEYLLEHPTAIRAALRPAWPEPDCVPDGSDSGFGERVPEVEWPKGVDLRVSTL